MRSMKALVVVMVGLLLGLGTPGKVRAEWVQLVMDGGNETYYGMRKYDFQLGTLNAPQGTSYVGVFVYDLGTDIWFMGFTGIIFDLYENIEKYNAVMCDFVNFTYYALEYDLENYKNLFGFDSIRQTTEEYKYYGLYSADTNWFNNKIITFVWYPDNEYSDQFPNIFLFIAYLDSNKTLLDWEGLAHFGNPPQKAVVPVPGTVLLFGSGLLGLAFLSRRLRRR